MSSAQTGRAKLLKMIKGGIVREYPYIERVHLRADDMHPEEDTAYIVHNGGNDYQGKAWETERLCRDIEDAKIIIECFNLESGLTKEQIKEIAEAVAKDSLFDDGRYIDRNYKGGI